MKVVIEKSVAKGTVSAPPSKSLAHRYIICAALADGKSVIYGVEMCEDILATLDCIKSLGADFELNGNTLTVFGINKEKAGNIFSCRESGSTLRFFIPLSLIYSNSPVFKGTKRLLSRGVGIYKEIFTPYGVTFSENKDSIELSGELQSGYYKLRGDVSSQFISGLFFALPLLTGESTVEITTPVESRSYIDITISVLKSFGVVIEEPEKNKFYIKGNQNYKPLDHTVEGDWSNGAFLLALDTLGGSVEVSGLDKKSLQGDRVCAGHLEKLKKGYADIDLSDTPDLAPVLFAVAAACHGGSFTGTKRLAIKESSRAEAMARELSKLGVKVIVEENRVTVEKGSLLPPKEAISSHNDHRIVMALATLLTVTGGEIEGAEAVNKSFHDYFNKISQLGIKVERYEH